MLKAGSSRYRDGSRSSIGDQWVNQACNALDRAMLKDIAANTSEFTVEQATQMLFPDDVIILLKQAEPLLATTNKHRDYDLQPHANCQITLNFKDHGAPSRNIQRFVPERGGVEFLGIVATINEKRRTWNMVNFVLKWLNNNATPGAIRALWPSVLTLCPKSPAFAELRHAPTRYVQPEGLAPMLPLLRETATTVAFYSLMPSTLEPRERHDLYLTFHHDEFIFEKVHVPLGYLTVSL